MKIGEYIKQYREAHELSGRAFAAGSEKDKIELIGHASGEQLRYYQDVELDDLRKLTDQL